VLLASVAAQAAERGASQAPSPTASSESQSTTITAEKMTVKNQENKAVFEGTVVLTRGSLIVHSDVMVVLFRPSNQPSSGTGTASANGVPGGPGASGKGTRSSPSPLPATGNRSVSMIEATGRVMIEKDEGRATSQKAVYFADEEKIVLTGEPVAWQKGTRVTGQKITMYLAEDRSVVEGGSRVQIEQVQGDKR
jgi:lipopolysaccharide export system protein LptA